MKKIRLWLLSFIVLLGFLGISYSTITTNAASDTQGYWNDVLWKFEASTGTLRFTSGGDIPKTAYPDNRPWFNSNSTDVGQAIKKIVFEETAVLPSDSSALFSGLTNLEEIEGFDKLDLSKAKLMVGIFSGCSSLSNVDGLAEWDVSEVTSTKNMFNGCTSLENINGLTNWNMGKVTNTSYMFSRTKIGNVDALVNWDLSSLTNMDGTFSSCESLENISGLANWNTKNVSDMAGVFSHNINLENVSPLANWDTGSVIHMDSMFTYSNIRNLDSLRSWNAENVSSMSYMFAYCSSLENADALGNWNAERLDSLTLLFYGCENLESVNLSSWNTGRIHMDGFERMFGLCSKLKSITLGRYSILNSVVGLPEIDTSLGKYTGHWIGINNKLIFVNSAALASAYNGSIPDTYVWREVDQSTIKVRDYTLYVGDEWTPENNFVNATDKDGNDLDLDSENTDWSIEWDGEVDTSIPGEYEVEFKVVEYYLGEERIEHATATATITVRERETSTYNAGYVFKSGTNGKALPKAVTDVLPSDTADYENDAIVTAISPEQTTVSTSSGTWTFQGWDADSKTVSGDDVVFTGTWTFEANESETPTYNVGYVFKSGTNGKALPKAVTDVLPSDLVLYKNDTVVTAISPGQTTVSTSSGTWTFQGWDADSKTVSGDDVIFTGTWMFEASEPEAPTYNAGYVFKSGTTGKALPKTVTDLLPSDTADYENDAIVTAISLEQTTVSASSGTWTFQGWDADSKTVSGDDVIFTGIWTFEASDSVASDNPNTPDTPNNSDIPSKPDNLSNPDKPSRLDKLKHPVIQNNLKTSDKQQQTRKITTKLPKTGDTQLSGLWGIAFLLSGITLLILKTRKRKKG